jgi:hypothetical protein
MQTFFVMFRVEIANLGFVGIFALESVFILVGKDISAIMQDRIELIEVICSLLAIVCSTQAFLIVASLNMLSEALR